MNKVIPFFERYPILGVKAFDFDDFKHVAVLIQNKEHLTAKGLSQIILITTRMNLDRDHASNGST